MLDNAWFVGIIGGIISGVLTFPITNYISSKIGKREYFKKVDSANNDVVHVLRLAVSEGDFPEQPVIDSIINATSRKYKVKVEDMLTGPLVIENIVKEVFDTSFISIEKKIENSKRLLVIKDTYQIAITIKDEPIENIGFRFTFGDNILNFIPLLGVVSVLFALTELTNISFLSLENEIKLSESLMILISTAAIVMSLLSTISTLKNKEKEKESIVRKKAG